MILVVGSGFLGSQLAKKIKEISTENILMTIRNKNREEYLFGAECIECDITCNNDLKKLADRVKDEEVNVFYLAACHNVDYVFKNTDIAQKINVAALKNFFNTIPNISRLIFSSTDCVYGEDSGVKLTESSPLNPVNEYGRQKIEAEKIVIQKGYTCVRLPFMIGKSLIEKPHFYDKFLSDLKDGKEYEMIDGMYRSVLSYESVSDILLSLIKCEAELPSIINIAGDKAYSKFEVGSTIAKKHNLDLKLVKKISEKESEKFFKDKRASSSVMDNSSLKQLLNLDKIMWEEDIC